ncbi:metal-dependent hydrolase [Hymenobacter properus]|uniref:Metal-dependent hydrolase n=1 Tax=Hymenobacter properus TaxID=2791026 RepID=A0A931BLZ1_9BACT|nr:metal-dependent hydrolase [Hymenobacter properus]MBF9142698.1 metal-dependent hydrolase [Hymenobacter properus]MBR7721506.1 metal-dependent hydrolase [Microvirga sp. SRT04]
MKKPYASNPVCLGLLLLGWTLVWIGHAYVVPTLRTPWLIGLADPAVHGLVSALLVLPLWLRRVIDFRVALLAVLLGVLIDLDHAVAAGSFSFKAMLSLPGRPLGHSLLVATLEATIVALALRGWSARYASWGPFYLFWVSLASHIARDGVTPWAWPVAAPPIPAAVFFGLFVPLSLAHWWAGLAWQRKAKASMRAEYET